MRRYAGAILIAWLVVCLLTGCTSNVRATDPPQTATEQFLQSEAVAQAVRQLNIEPLRDRLAYVDGAYVSDIDRRFMLGEFRAHLLSNGVRLTEKRDDAQVLVEVRSAGRGVDRSTLLVGIPPMVMPAGSSKENTLTYVTQFATPELSLFKNIRQMGYASIAFVAYFPDTGEVIAGSGPFVGKTYRTDWWVLGLGHQIRGNIATADEIRE